MNREIAETYHEKPLPLTALDDSPSTPTGSSVTPSSFRKKFKLASISAKSKRFLSFRGSASKDRRALSTVSVVTTSSHTSASDNIGEVNVPGPIASPISSPTDLSSGAQSEVDQNHTEPSNVPFEGSLYTPRLKSPILDMCEPESPTVGLAQKRAQSNTRAGEVGHMVKPFCLDNTQLIYANSMEALSNDFAEHVFPESPLFATDIPKSEINIPYPAIPVSASRAKSLGFYTFREDTAPPKAAMSVEPPAEIKIDTPAENTMPTVSPAPVAEMSKGPILDNRSSWLHIAKTVQHAAKHLSNDEDMSPIVLFQTLGPVVLLLYGIVAGVFLKRYHNELHVAFGLTGLMKPAMLFVLIVAGAVTTLITLKLTILMATSLLKTFAEMDLEDTFYKGECVAANGKAVGESDILIGSFIFAAPSSPAVG